MSIKDYLTQAFDIHEEIKLKNLREDVPTQDEIESIANAKNGTNHQYKRH